MRKAAIGPANAHVPEREDGIPITVDIEAAPEIEERPAEAAVPEIDVNAVFPGPERFERPVGKREPIECRYGFKAIVVPEMSLANYRSLGWMDAFHTQTGRSDAGIVVEEVKFQTDPGGRLMRDGSYVMVMRPDTHARLLEEEKAKAQAPLRSMSRGREGVDPEYFSVAYSVIEGRGRRPEGAMGALPRDDD